MSKEREFIQRNHVKRLYCAYVQSVVAYGILIYGYPPESDLTEKTKGPKNTIKVIYFIRTYELVYRIMNCFLCHCFWVAYIFELFKEVFGELRKVNPMKLLNLSELLFRSSTEWALKGILLTKSRAEGCPLNARMNKTYNFLKSKLVDSAKAKEND